MRLLAQNLLFLRTAKGLQQSEIPANIGFPQNTWSRWENDKQQPSIEDALTIADFFGISIDELARKNLKEDVHLTKKLSGGKKVHPNVHGSVHPKGKKEDVLTLAAEDQQQLTIPYPELCKMVREMRKELNKIKR